MTGPRSDAAHHEKIRVTQRRRAHGIGPIYGSDVPENILECPEISGASEYFFEAPWGTLSRPWGNPTFKRKCEWTWTLTLTYRRDKDEDDGGNQISYGSHADRVNQYEFYLGGERGKGWHPPPRCGEVMNGPIRRHEIKHLLCESRQWKIYAASSKSCSSSSAAWGAEELAAKLATYMFRRL